MYFAKVWKNCENNKIFSLIISYPSSLSLFMKTGSFGFKALATGFFWIVDNLSRIEFSMASIWKWKLPIFSINCTQCHKDITVLWKDGGRMGAGGSMHAIGWIKLCSLPDVAPRLYSEHPWFRSREEIFWRPSFSAEEYM